MYVTKKESRNCTKKITDWFRNGLEKTYNNNNVSIMLALRLVADNPKLFYKKRAQGLGVGKNFYIVVSQIVNPFGFHLMDIHFYKFAEIKSPTSVNFHTIKKYFLLHIQIQNVMLMANFEKMPITVVMDSLP